MRILSTLMVLLFWTLCAFPAAAGDFRAVLTKDRLTVEARDIALKRILNRLSRQGVRIRIDPRINPLVTVAFQKRAVSEGLEAMLRPHGYSHALIWKGVDGPTGTLAALEEIQVFEAGHRGRMGPMAAELPRRVAADPETGAIFVADEVLIRTAAGVDLRTLEERLRAIGGVIVEGLSGIGAYRVRLTEPADVSVLTRSLLQDSAIAAAEPNYLYPVSAPIRHGNGSGRRIIDADTALPPGDAVVAILDTGLDPDAQLSGLVAAAMNAVDPRQEMSDEAGHGTQMALIASGLVTPLGEGLTPWKAGIIPVRALDGNGLASVADIVSGIEFAYNEGARVMSLSWGSETRSVFLEEALDAVTDRGVVVTASAGNEPSGRPVYPAAYASVVGVGALAPDGRPWSRSNSGDFVSVYAPGFAEMPVGYGGEPGIYAGTSIAAAYAAHRIARHLSLYPRQSFDGLPEKALID